MLYVFEAWTCSGKTCIRNAHELTMASGHTPWYSLSQVYIPAQVRESQIVDTLLVPTGLIGQGGVKEAQKDMQKPR